MDRWLVLVLVVLLCVGCGAATRQTTAAATAVPPTAAPATPAQVHAAWVAAMRDNDRATLLALAADTELKTFFVDERLRSVQERVQVQPDGPLAQVEVLAPTAAGAGQVGFSRWHFAERRECYRTELALEQGMWKVTSWGITEHCPDAMEGGHTDGTHPLAAGRPECRTA